MPNNNIKKDTKFFQIKERAKLETALLKAFRDSGMTYREVAGLLNMDESVVRSLISELPRSITDYRLELLKKLASELGAGAVEVGPARVSPIGRGSPKKASRHSRQEVLDFAKAEQAKQKPVTKPSEPHVVVPEQAPVPVGRDMLALLRTGVNLRDFGVLSPAEADVAITRIVMGKLLK